MIIIMAVIIVVGIVIKCSVDHFTFNNRAPDKNERINNMLIYRGSTEITDSDIVNDIESVLSGCAKWDNLFLSEQFKSKYKSRSDFIEKPWKISNIWSGADDTKENEVIIYAGHRVPFWDNDESDNIATRYVFKYYRNNKGELDDLELIDKKDVYVIDGEPVL